MENWIIEMMEQFGYLGILLLIAIENLFPPIPSEVILTFGGFMTTRTDLTPLGVIVVATLGSVIGAIILYYIGRILDVERLEKIVDRWGKVLRVKKEDLHRADAWFDKHGNKAVFFCRMVPLIRSLISVPAGMSGMKLTPFLIYTTLGTIIWNTILVMLGTTLGDRWEDIVAFMDVYSNIAYAIIAIIIVIVLILYLRRFRKK
ncbi:alkaline phosphatase-like protein [Paenibacillus montaniterrae]|uniref:Alkaline phosphatase-like protein n=1 Tax=Paenibacillus montaniterrae TaxID=429341 RepID=A0A919YLN7_9BACL|nr:DedA family protein [Paenibacillus montaniterrae]GIP15765.1 alkaline phosphatase-like protein [Paenibacillus montaniterrae]